MNEPNPMQEAAARYLARGWSVLPLQPAEKRPLIRWEGLQQARAEDATLAQWFARWPDANVGVVTGEISNLIVLDVDPRHGGADSLARLERRHGTLPETVTAQTAGGGRCGRQVFQ
ncbi:MAG: bifunctional DNA primase/polymerase, partial [Pseudorhodoplanes sp.]|nr:bifunctional DNA primase/polymerase [Pseudorhodoplanes sp.]